MEPEGSLPHSQMPATCPYSEPAQSSPYPTTHFLKIHLNTILPSMPGSPKWPIFFRFLHQNTVHFSPLLSSIRVTCPAHLILLDFITRKIVGEAYRSLSSSLRTFLHSPATSFLLGPFSLLRLHQSISPGLRLSFLLFCNTVCFYGEEMLAPRPSPKLEDHPLSGFRLLIQYIRSYPPYWSLFLHSQPEDAPCCGDRDPLITEPCLLYSGKQSMNPLNRSQCQLQCWSGLCR